jgi:hypothetical protein
LIMGGKAQPTESSHCDIAIVDPTAAADNGRLEAARLEPVASGREGRASSRPQPRPHAGIFSGRRRFLVTE